MAASPERREGGDREREGGVQGMASGGTEEDGVLPGPWGAQMGEGSPLWGWTGDEETLPLSPLRR